MNPSEIKDIRKRLGLTADQFAERLGLTGKHRARTVFKWERGVYTPSKLRQEMMMAQSEISHD